MTEHWGARRATRPGAAAATEQRLEFEDGSDRGWRDCRSRAIRAGRFEPQLIPKGHRRFDGFDD